MCFLDTLLPRKDIICRLSNISFLEMWYSMRIISLSPHLCHVLHLLNLRCTVMTLISIHMSSPMFLLYLLVPLPLLLLLHLLYLMLPLPLILLHLAPCLLLYLLCFLLLANNNILLLLSYLLHPQFYLLIRQLENLLGIILFLLICEIMSINFALPFLVQLYFFHMQK